MLFLQPNQVLNLLLFHHPNQVLFQQPEPSAIPTTKPSSIPTTKPSSIPTTKPSSIPTSKPTAIPSTKPSTEPTAIPSSKPSSIPTSIPSSEPSAIPTSIPSSEPTAIPSSKPSSIPTSIPSSEPSSIPTSKPSPIPTSEPSAIPSSKPSANPTSKPSPIPSSKPSSIPTSKPSSVPTSKPSAIPTSKPSPIPTSKPSPIPTSEPSAIPSSKPSSIPTSKPSSVPTSKPSSFPTSKPSSVPTSKPSSEPTGNPSSNPSANPTSNPSYIPSSNPSYIPSSNPSYIPTTKPSSIPTSKPSANPTSKPSANPTTKPSSRPTTKPSSNPTNIPSNQPQSIPTFLPTLQPFSIPTSNPSSIPWAIPTFQPSSTPSTNPSHQPSTNPTSQPSSQPTSFPSSFPTIQPTIAIVSIPPPTYFNRFIENNLIDGSSSISKQFSIGEIELTTFITWKVSSLTNIITQNQLYESFFIDKMEYVKDKSPSLFAYWEYIHKSNEDYSIIKATCNETDKITILHNLFNNFSQFNNISSYEFECNNYVWNFNKNNNQLIVFNLIRRLKETINYLSHSLPISYYNSVERTGFMGFKYDDSINGGGEVSIDNLQLGTSQFEILEQVNDYTQESISIGMFIIPILIFLGWAFMKSWDKFDHNEKNNLSSNNSIFGFNLQRLFGINLNYNNKSTSLFNTNSESYRFKNILCREHALISMFFHASTIFPRHIRYLMIWYRLITCAFITICFLLMFDLQYQIYIILVSSFFSCVCVSFVNIFIWRLCSKSITLENIKGEARFDSLDYIYKESKSLFFTNSKKEATFLIKESIKQQQHNLCPESKNNIKNLIHMNSLGQPNSLNFVQWIMYGNRKKYLQNKIDKSILKASEIIYELQKIGYQNEDCQNIYLLQEFIIDQFSNLKQFLVKRELTQYEHVQSDNIKPIIFALSWFLILFSSSFMIVSISTYIWLNKKNDHFLQLFYKLFQLVFLYEVLCIETIKCYIVNVEFMKSCKKQLKNIKWVLESISVNNYYSFNKEKPIYNGLTNYIHKHLLGSVRACYLPKVENLQSVKIIKQLTDTDIVECRKYKNNFHNYYTNIFLLLPSKLANIDIDLGIYSLEILNVIQVNLLFLVVVLLKNNIFWMTISLATGISIYSFYSWFNLNKKKSSNTSNISIVKRTFKKMTYSSKENCIKNWKNMNKPQYQQGKLNINNNINYFKILNSKPTRIEELKYEYNNEYLKWINKRKLPYLKYRYGFLTGNEKILHLPRPDNINNYSCSDSELSSWDSDFNTTYFDYETGSDKYGSSDYCSSYDYDTSYSSYDYDTSYSSYDTSYSSYDTSYSSSENTTLISYYSDDSTYSLLSSTTINSLNSNYDLSTISEEMSNVTRISITDSISNKATI